MIDQKFIEERKKELEKEKSRIEKELERVATKKGKDFKPIYPEYGNDEDENAQETTQYELNFALDRNLEKILTKVLRALRKIEEGTYGLSELSGKEINPERLEAFPVANFTIDEEIEREKNPFKKVFKKIKNHKKK